MNKQKGSITPLLVAALALLAIGSGYVYYHLIRMRASSPSLVTENNLIGGSKDAHGCIGPAGYSWCAIKNKCLRVWEERCEAGSRAAATTSIESSVINSKSDDKNAMSDWKTFTKYGFEFRYPSEWIVKDFEGMRYGFILSDDTLLFTPRRISPKDSIRINFSLMDNTANNYTLDKLAGCINSDTQIILECKDININGVSYKKVIAKHSSSEVGGLPINLDKKSIKVVTVFDNKSLLVEATLNDKDPLDEKVIWAKFDSILPTFRFKK